MKHPFEESGLGYAPFRCVNVLDSKGTSCSHCGTPIRWVFMIQDAKGSMFKVGSSCVEKTEADVKDFAKVKAEHVKALRDAKHAKIKAEREAKWAEIRQARIDQNAKATKEWKEANQEVADFLTAYDGDNSFLNSVKTYMDQGGLSINQTVAVQRIVDKNKSVAKLANTSKFIGHVGEKIVVKARIANSKYTGQTSFYPHLPRFLVTLITEDENQLTWWTSKDMAETKEFMDIKCTVRDHSEYNNVKQTVVTRCKFM